MDSSTALHDFMGIPTATSASETTPRTEIEAGTTRTPTDATTTASPTEPDDPGTHTPAAQASEHAGHGRGMGGGPSPSIVETHTSERGFPPRFAAPTPTPAPPPSHGSNHGSAPDHASHPEPEFDPGSPDFSDIGSIASSKAPMITMTDEQLQAYVDRRVRSMVADMQNDGNERGMGAGTDRGGPRGGGAEADGFGPHNRSDPAPTTTPTPRRRTSSHGNPHRYGHNNNKADGNFRDDQKCLTALTFMPDETAIVELVKEARNAAKDDPTVDFSVSPTFSRKLHHLIASNIQKQPAISVQHVLDLGFSSLLRSSGLGASGMYVDMETAAVDPVPLHHAELDASLSGVGFQRRAFETPATPSATSLPHSGVFTYNRAHHAAYDTSDEMMADVNHKTDMAAAFVAEQTAEMEDMGITDDEGQSPHWASTHNTSIKDPTACCRTAAIFIACDRVVLKIMVALLQAMEDSGPLHDFSRLKNLLTSATAALDSLTGLVHTTMQVRPSVADILFQVSQPGLDVMLIALTQLRSPNPTKVLKAVGKCLDPHINPYASLSEAEAVFKSQLDTLHATVGTKDLLSDDIQVLLWAAILAKLNISHVQTWGSSYQAYHKSINGSLFNPATAQLLHHDQRLINAKAVLPTISTAHSDYGGARDEQRYKRSGTLKVAQAAAHTADPGAAEEVGVVDHDPGITDEEGWAAAASTSRTHNPTPPVASSHRPKHDHEYTHTGHLRVPRGHRSYGEATRLLTAVNSDGWLLFSNKSIKERHDEGKLKRYSYAGHLELGVRKRNKNKWQVVQIVTPSPITESNIKGMNAEELALYIFLSGGMDDNTKGKREAHIKDAKNKYYASRGGDNPRDRTVGSASYRPAYQHTADPSSLSPGRHSTSKFWDQARSHKPSGRYSTSQKAEVADLIKAAADYPNATVESVVQNVVESMDSRMEQLKDEHRGVKSYTDVRFYESDDDN